MGAVARNAKRIMNEKCLKQSLVAKKAGFGVKDFSAIITGRKIMREEYISSIADALGVQPNELFIEHTTTA
jgi:transcriptional regulator with XRE-family HTH domain